MLRNYLLVALRALGRRPGYTALNVGGLALGVACCLLIGLYVRHEWSYDRFHPGHERLVRVVQDTRGPKGERSRTAATQAVLAHTLRQDPVPGIRRVVRVDYNPNVLVEVEGERTYVEEALAADATFFTVFGGFDLLRGDPATVLDAPGSVVLSASFARRLFGPGADPVGRTLRYENAHDLTVTGVAADPPATSHITFDAVVAFSTFEEDDGEGGTYRNWFAFAFQTYAELAPGTDRAQVAEALAGRAARYAGDKFDRPEQIVHRMEPITDVRLVSDYGEMGATGRSEQVRVFALAAVFVLVIAGVNFVNLATARASERAQEVGVRKSLGAGRAALVRQFLVEAVLLASAATALGVVLAATAHPFFEDLAGQALPLDVGLAEAGVVVALTLGLGLGAGGYPALVLTRFDPARTLRGTGRTASGGGPGWMRRGLVVTQFALSTLLVAVTAVTFAQLRHMQSQRLGLDTGDGATEHVVTLDFGGDAAVQQRLDAVRQQMLDVPGVTGATAALTAPAASRSWGAGGEMETEAGTMEAVSVRLLPIDAHYIDFFGLEIVAGRGLDPDRATDVREAFVLNETAVRTHGFSSPEAALGKRVDLWNEGVVVGVVADYHLDGLQERIPALAMQHRPSALSVLSLRLMTDDLPATMDAVEAAWARAVPERPFRYTFLDDAFDAAYKSERRFGRVFGVFAGLAIAIACLGMLGLAAYTMQRRTKEIGIRKTLGASAASVVALLTKETAALVGVAFVLAVPPAYLYTQRWLAGFAYRIDLGPSVFLVAGALVAALALAVTALHALRAAYLDPVKALRSE